MGKGRKGERVGKGPAAPPQYFGPEPPWLPVSVLLGSRQVLLEGGR